MKPSLGVLSERRPPGAHGAWKGPRGQESNPAGATRLCVRPGDGDVGEVGDVGSVEDTFKSGESADVGKVSRLGGLPDVGDIDHHADVGIPGRIGNVGNVGDVGNVAKLGTPSPHPHERPLGERWRRPGPASSAPP